VSEADLRFVAFLRDVEDNLGSLPLRLVLREVEVVVEHEPGDSLVGNELNQLHCALVVVLVVVSEFIANIAGAALNLFRPPCTYILGGTEGFLRGLIDKMVAG
jgi:hypothetical protein